MSGRWFLDTVPPEMTNILLTGGTHWDEAWGILVVQVVENDCGAVLRLAQSVELQIALLQKFEEGVPGIGKTGGDIARRMRGAAMLVRHIKPGCILRKQ